MIELAGVRFAHPRGPDLLASIDLTVSPGEVVIVDSAAGAGSTTLVRLLLGELSGQGRVAIAGREVSRLRRASRAALRRRLGVVPQELGLVGHDSALANVALALEVCGVRAAERRARAEALLATVDVEAGVAVERLAMAARQRVAWARALVRSPDIVIADQPTSHQDAAGAARFAELVAERASLGAACLIVARDPHLLAAAAGLGWRSCALHAGTIVDAMPARAITAELAPVDAEALIEVEIDVDVESSAPLAAPPPARETAGSIDVPDIAPAIALPPGPPAEPPSDLDLTAIPNVVPFPRARSAGNRR